MKKKRYSTGSMMVFLGAGAVIAAACLYMLTYSRASALAASAVDDKDKTVAVESERMQGTDLLSVYKSTADDRSRLPGFFVPSQNAVSFINALEAIGTQSGASISIASINADDMSAAAPGSIGHIAASVQASGSWAQVMKALALTESLPYGSSVSRATLTDASQGPSSKPSGWSLSLQIEALMLKSASSTRS